MNAIQALSQLSYGPTLWLAPLWLSTKSPRASQAQKMTPQDYFRVGWKTRSVVIVGGHIGQIVEGDGVVIVILQQIIIHLDRVIVIDQDVVICDGFLHLGL